MWLRVLIWIAGCWTATAQAGEYDVVTPGWATERHQAELLQRAEANDQLLVVMRSADQYKTESRRVCVNIWAQAPAFRGAAKLRLPTSTSSNPIYKALRAQLTEPTGAPDLWLATADLKLLAYVPYPGGEKPEEAIIPAVKRAAELFGFYQGAKKSLAFAEKHAAAGRVGVAWQSVSRIARQDAKLQKALRSSDDEDTQALADFDDLPDDLKPAYEDPGPGYFFGTLFVDKLTEYETIAEDRVNRALESIGAGDTAEARRLITPILQRPMNIEAVQEARRVLLLASEVDRATAETEESAPAED